MGGKGGNEGGGEVQTGLVLPKGTSSRRGRLADRAWLYPPNAPKQHAVVPKLVWKARMAPKPVCQASTAP